jgi:hypothetical protein
MRFAIFDLETARILPPDTANIIKHMPLGISCAAVALSDGPTEVWHGAPQLDRAGAQELVRRMEALVAQGYVLVTWNGASFDFRVLAAESGMEEACGRLAMDHCDLMAVVVCIKGYRLGLQKVLEGAGMAGKTTQYRLPDGRMVDPSGANAPILWDEGHYDAVLSYLTQDVEQMRDLMPHILRRRGLFWTSGRGKPQSLPLPSLLSVRDCMALPLPDTAWMDNPPSRAELVEWIPAHLVA